MKLVSRVFRIAQTRVKEQVYLDWINVPSYSSGTVA